MDHPASVPQYAWRTTAIVAAGVAAFELVLLVLIALAFLGTTFLGGGGDAGPIEQKVRAEAAAPKGESVATPAPAAAKEPSAPAETEPKLARGETSVMVLNGNGVQGAAAQATEQIRRFSYLITGTGNAPRTDFARSLVMYRPGFRGEALRLARDLDVGRVAPLDGMRRADLQGAQLALIVGAS